MDGLNPDAEGRPLAWWDSLVPIAVLGIPLSLVT